MAKKRTQKSMRRELVNSFIKAADDRIRQEQEAAKAQAEMQAQMGVQPDYAKGLTRADVDNILKSYDSQQEIPKLEQNTTPTTPTAPTPSIADELERMKKVKADTTTPRTEGEQKAIDTYYNGLMEASGKAPKQNTPKVDYKAEIDRMNALKADTTAQRTEGENKAIDTYLEGLTEAQRYLDSQRKSTTAAKKNTTNTKKVEKQPIVTVRTDDNGSRNYTKTMSANEQRDYERALEAQARAVGREAKKNAAPKERALSANEQRDYERALEAQAKAKEREKVTTENVNQPMPTRANENLGDELVTGKIVKSPVPEATPTPNGVPEKAKNPNVDSRFGLNNALANPQQNGVLTRNNYDLMRAAAFSSALNHNIPQETPIDDSKWLVKKDELDSMLQDENFASDMEKLRQVEFDNANQDATVSDEWANEYGAKAITGGYTKDEYYKLLEDKYGLDKAKLNDIADTLQYYEREQDRQQTSQDFYNLANSMSNAKFGPLRTAGRTLGTLGSYVGTAGSAVEGAWNAGAAFLTGDPRTQSHLFDTTKNALRSGVADSYSGLGSTIYNVGAGVGDLGVGLAMGNPALVLAGNTAGEATTNAIERGADVNKAGLTGIGAGVADYFFNKVGLDKAKEQAMTKLTEAGVKKFLKANAIAGRTEGLENVLQDFTESIIDNILNGENSEIRTNYANYKANGMDDGDALFHTAMDYLGQVGVSGLTGVAMGSAMQAVPSLTGGALDYMFTPDENYRNKTFWGSVSKIIDQKNGKLNPLENEQKTETPQQEITKLEEQEKVEQPTEQPTEPIKAQEEIGKEPIQNTPQEPVGEEPKVTTEPVKTEEVPEKITEEPVNNQPENPQRPNNYTKLDADHAYSRVYTNALTKAGVIDMKNSVNKINAVNDVRHKSAVLDEAQKVWEKEGDTWGDRVASGDKVLDGDTDVSTAFLVMKDNDLKIKQAQANGDMNAVAKFVAKRDALGRKLRFYGHKIGAAVKAFDYFNGTADGAIVNAQRMFDEMGSKWAKSKENGKALKENTRLAQALSDMGHKPEDAPGKTPLTHEQVRAQVEETIRREMGSVADKFDSKAIDFLTSLAEDRSIETWQITDELEHFLNHGEFYPIEADTTVKLQKSAQLSKILDRIVEGKTDSERIPDTYEQVREKVVNTLNEEFAGFEKNFTDQDVDFISSMLFHKIPQWRIEDEIRHKLLHGDFYELSDDVKTKPEPMNGKLRSALNKLVAEDVRQEPVKKSYEQIRQEVQNTLDNEFGSMAKKFTDSDVDYLSRMIENNISMDELTSLLNTKMATGVFDIPQETIDKVNDLFNRAQQFGENSKQRVDLETQAFWELANVGGKKSSIADKFEAWRYLAMLGNPKTHLRNMIGNALFSGVTGISNNLAAMMEAGVDRSTKRKGEREAKQLRRRYGLSIQKSDSAKGRNEIPRLNEKAKKLQERAQTHLQGINRTKSVLNLANANDRALVKGSNQDSIDNAYRQLTGQKYNDNKSVKNAIKEQKEVFDTKTVNTLNNLNNKALTAEDTTAMRFKYSTSLAGWLKANGFDASIFDDEKAYKQMQKDYSDGIKVVDKAKMNELGERVAKLEQAREYAIKQAEYAAFHEDNAAADFISKISRDANSSEYGAVRGMGKMIEGVLPFKKTPLNILASGFRDYSPVGIVRGITKLAQSKSGKAEVSEALEALAQGITGSALVGIGALLYDKGLLTMSEDDDSKWQNALEGNQNFAIKFGPKDSKYTATIDFAVPSVMPLFLGAQLKKMWDANPENADKPFFEHLEAALKNTKEHPLDVAGNAFVAGSRLLSPVAETSMLQGVNNTLESISEGNGIDALANLGLTLGTGYLSQGFPTVLGQAARIIDPVRRSTYSSENTELGRTFDKQLEKIQNKTPFWSMTNEPYLDAYGREQMNSPANTGNKVADFALNTLYQTLSPSYIQKVNQTPADINAWEVYNGLDEAGKPIRDDQVFASVAPLSINGERLSDEDNYKYNKMNGETNLAIRNALVNQDWYNALSPLEQKEILKSTDTFTKNFGQYTVAPDSLNVGDDLQDFLDAGYNYDDRGFRRTNIDSGVQSFLDNKEAQYNPYGLSKNRYQELKSEGTDLTKYQGFKEALEASGTKDSKKLEEVWLGKALETDSDGLNGAYFGRGAEGVQKYTDYDNARKELDINDSKGAMKAYLYDGGEQGLVKYQEHRQSAVDAGYVTADGEPNVDRYDKVYKIMQNDNDTKNFASFYDQMERNKTDKEEQYIPVLEGMNLTTEQRGKYAYAMAKTVGKNGQAALDNYGYEGYYLYKVLDTVQDIDHDGEIKDDRKRILNEWGIKLNDAETAASYEYFMKMFYPKKWNT